jgi:DnaJ-class molecular chaperone
MATTFKDYYAILGVPRTATDKEIRAAFRKLARKHHPDVNQGDKSAEDRFKEINEANEVLGDPEKRKKYDELGPRWQEYEQWERAGRPGPNPFSGGDQFGYRTVSPDELEGMFGSRAPFSDFFQQFFGGEPDLGGPTRGRRRVARRGQDVEGDAEISLDEAYTGSTLTVDMSSAEGPRRVEVKIPAGIHEGARVRATGQGSPGRGGGPRGDLFIRVHIRPHRVFTRTIWRSGCRRRSPPRLPAGPCRCRPSGGRPPSSRFPRARRTAPGSGFEGSACRISMARVRAICSRPST